MAARAGADVGSAYRYVPVAQDASTVARALAAERPYLKLAPPDPHAVAISAMDAKLAAEPHDPTCSPLQVGVLEWFVDPYRAGRASLIYRMVGGQEVIVIVPLKAKTGNVELAVAELVDTVISEMEPAPIDD